VALKQVNSGGAVGSIGWPSKRSSREI